MTTHQDQENALVAHNSEFRLLPELWIVILEKTVLVQIYSKDTAAKRQRDNTIFSSLASVDFRWWCTLKKCCKRNLRNKIRHLSKVYFQRAKIRSTIIRNNREFLKEVINPETIIFPLESWGCLTEDQVIFLNQLRNRKDKNLELLFMLQDFSSQKYSIFVDCLFATNQTPAALVLERGGEAVKVQINIGKSRFARILGIEFCKRIRRMQTENTLMLEEFNEILNDVFLIHAKPNKVIELWFWCKTKCSSNQLESLSEEDIGNLIGLSRPNLLDPTDLQPLQVDFVSHFASDFAERRLSIRHVGEHLTATEIFRRFTFSQLLTTLGDKIYVVQKTEISVYWNKYPYNSLKSIVLSYEEYPFKLASCNINKCLYISLPENGRILKVEPMLDNRVSEWFHETGLFIMSVTSRGDVLVLQIGFGDNYELRIITHEGTVKRSISMEDHYRQTQNIQEIMPDIVALSYHEWPKDVRSCIAIMRLDENGTVLRNIEWQQNIMGLYSFRYGDLFIRVLGRQRNYNKLQHLTYESKVARDLLTTDSEIMSLHFDADQKQLYVLYSFKLDVYQLHYQDELYN